MEPYIFIGVVLPERAQLSFQIDINFTHFSSGFCGEANINVIKNQVAIRIESEADWELETLRNVVKTMVQNELAKISYLIGCAYDLEIIRVLNQSRGIDYVFGIDIPCIAERGYSIDIDKAIGLLRQKANGDDGIYLHRCFADLVSSMKHADDTGFYCYRAIESLRQHCAAQNGMSDAKELRQWEKFRKIARCDKQSLLTIKAEADPLRHGGVSSVTSDERAKLLMNTWDIVDGYLDSI